MRNEYAESLQCYDEDRNEREQFEEFIERSQRQAEFISEKHSSYRRVIGFFNGRYFEE